MDIPQKSDAKLSLQFINDECLDPIYEQVCYAVDESVVNAILHAEDMTSIKPAGKVVKAIDHEQLVKVLQKYNRIHR